MNFKPIPGYEGLYSASECGQILSHGRSVIVGNNKIARTFPALIMKQQVVNRYLVVKLSRNKKIKNKGVHVLVALAHNEKPENATEVNHKDFNRHNNNKSNLEWVTKQGNVDHAYKNGAYLFGKDHPRSKIVLDTQTGIFYFSITEAAKAKGVGRALLSHYLRGVVPNRTSIIYA